MHFSKASAKVLLFSETTKYFEKKLSFLERFYQLQTLKRWKIYTTPYNIHTHNAHVYISAHIYTWERIYKYCYHSFWNFNLHFLRPLGLCPTPPVAPGTFALRLEEFCPRSMGKNTHSLGQICLKLRANLLEGWKKLTKTLVYFKIKLVVTQKNREKSRKRGKTWQQMTPKWQQNKLCCHTLTIWI